MKRLWKRGLRLGVMTLGFAGLFAAVNAVPGVATPPNSEFHSTIVARGTYVDRGTLPLTMGLDIVVSQIVSNPGGSSGWHSHPGGAIAVVGCAGTGCHSEVTLYESVGGHCVITKYTQGQTFLERPGDVVVAINTGTTDTIIYATFPGVPVGGLPRIDRANPGTCPGV